MSRQTLKERVDALEKELAQLKAGLAVSSPGTRPWWEEIAGTFTGDPDYEKAMELGRKYRRSSIPKTRKRRNGRSGH